MDVRPFLAAVCLTASCSAPLVAADEVDDPNYDGKPLSVWAEELSKGELGTTFAYDTGAPTDAFRAFRVLKKQAIPLLVRRSRDASPLVRRNVYMALGAIGPDARDAVPVLIRGLAEQHPNVRRAAIDALGDLGPAAVDAIPELAKRLREDKLYPNPPDAFWAICGVSAEALAMIGPEAVPVLVEATRAPSETVRIDAIEALGTMRDSVVDVRPIVEALVRALADREPIVIGTAADVLPSFGRDARGAYRPLAALIGDERDSQLGWQHELPLSTLAQSALHRLLDRHTPSERLRFLGGSLSEELRSPRDAAVRIAVRRILITVEREQAMTAAFTLGDRIPAETILRRFPQWPLLNATAGAVELLDRRRALRLARDPESLDYRRMALDLVRFWRWKDPDIVSMLGTYLDPGRNRDADRIVAACLLLRTGAKSTEAAARNALEDALDEEMFLLALDASIPGDWWIESLRTARDVPAVRRIVAEELRTWVHVHGPRPLVLDALSIVASHGAYESADLVDSLGDEDPDERSTALYVLGASGAAARPDLPKVLDALRDDFAEVRRAAIWAAPRIVGAERSDLRDRLVAGLVAAFADPDPVTRRDAVAALAAFGPSARHGVPRLRKLLEDRHAIVRHAARGTLRALGEIPE